MKRSTIAFLVFAVVMAGICVRLGIWQLDRREQRRAMNAQVRQRMLMPAVPVEFIGSDSAAIRFRQVLVRGQPDPDHEIRLTHRGRDGAPGVDVLTPMRIAGSDTAVMVNRGWVYSPDGMTIEPERWRESTTVYFGYVNTFDSVPTDSVRNGGVRRASIEAISRAMPYPIAPYYVVALDDPSRGDSAIVPGRPIRLAPPKLDEGPHLSYAFQWFGFAMIALVGAGIVAARSMR